jgi:Fe-S-cluster containining protein
MADAPWFSKGLSFQCTGCGKCCTGSPGYVWVTEEEIQSMADYLKMTKEEFIKQYVRQVGHRLSLRERPRNFDCVFLKDKQCTLYPVRPKQCKTFPWWKENLSSVEAWEEAAKWCEGINHPDAPVIPLEDIQKQS